MRGWGGGDDSDAEEGGNGADRRSGRRLERKEGRDRPLTGVGGNIEDLGYILTYM